VRVTANGAVYQETPAMGRELPWESRTMSWAFSFKKSLNDTIITLPIKEFMNQQAFLL